MLGISTGVLFLGLTVGLGTVVGGRAAPWFNGQTSEGIATVLGENLGPGMKWAAGVVVKENAWPIIGGMVQSMLRVLGFVAATARPRAAGGRSCTGDTRAGPRRGS